MHVNVLQKLHSVPSAENYTFCLCHTHPNNHFCIQPHQIKRLGENCLPESSLLSLQ